MDDLLQASIGELVVINPHAVHSSAHHHLHDLLSVLLCCCMTLICSFQQTFSLFILIMNVII